MRFVLSKFGKWPNPYLPPKPRKSALSGPVAQGSGVSSGKSPATEDIVAMVRFADWVLSDEWLWKCERVARELKDIGKQLDDLEKKVVELKRDVMRFKRVDE